MRVWAWAALAGLVGWVSPARGDERLEEIRAAITREGQHWSAGETAISRLSPEARLRRIAPSGSVPPWVSGAAAGAPQRVSPLPMPMPAALDWRDLRGHGFLPPVRDQGACGSCWAFAMVGALEPLMAQRASAPGPVLDLSEQHLLDCAASSLGCDSGGLTWGPPGAFLTREGVTEERCYPYLSGASGERGSCSAGALSADCVQGTVRTDRVIELIDTMPAFPQWNPPDFALDDSSAKEIKGLLDTRPVGVTMRVFDDLHYYRSGIYAPTSTAQRGGLHAVVLVGYDDAGGYWIVRNSWGEDWGEQGYLRLRYGASSIGMYAFAFEYEEARAVPAFCGELPSRLELDTENPGAAAGLHLANCGGGVLAWQLSSDQDWVVVETAAGEPVDSGEEVAVGTSYRVRLAAPVTPGARATLTLTGAGNGPVRVAITTGGAGLEAEEATADLSEEATPSGGCGCTASGAPAGLPGLLLLVLAALRLRRSGLRNR